jgi:hypothetical protein
MHILGSKASDINFLEPSDAHRTAVGAKWESIFYSCGRGPNIPLDASEFALKSID